MFLLRVPKSTIVRPGISLGVSPGSFPKFHLKITPVVPSKYVVSTLLEILYKICQEIPGVYSGITCDYERNTLGETLVELCEVLTLT